MGQNVSVIDTASAGLSKFTNMNIEIPLSTTPITGYKFAEFGLQVNDSNGNPGSFSTVHLHGTIGVINPGLLPITVRVVITRRNTLLLGAPEISIFETDYTVNPLVLGILGSGSTTISFDTYDGDAINPMPSGYYGYSAYVEISPLVIVPISIPILSGPAAFEGVSYVKNMPNF